MLVLGLGSNVGDKLQNLRKTILELKKISTLTLQQISPIYISDALLPENAPPDWDMPYLNIAVRCETSLKPIELLKKLKEIEWSIGRKPEVRHWGPRVVDIDILAWDDLIIQSDELTVPHENLQVRPFALWPLADVAPFWKFPLEGINQNKTAAQMVEVWGSRFSGDAPFHTKQIYQRIEPPQLMGVINVTPDSFSDGMKFFDPGKASQQALELVQQGAEIIDIGAESTSPRAEAIDAETEWQRLEPVLSAIKDVRKQFILPPKLSLDTRHADVAKKALNFGVEWINDVTGLDDPAMREIVAQSQADCVVMHHLSIPERRDHVLPRDQDVVKAVLEWGERRIQELEKFGIAKERIIFDPGIGFGKMAEQSFDLLKRVSEFQKLGTRLLLGHSRKTFLSLLSSRPFADRDIETLAITLYLAKHNVDYVRLHNVEICARALKVAEALENDHYPERSELSS